MEPEIARECPVMPIAYLQTKKKLPDIYGLMVGKGRRKREVSRREDKLSRFKLRADCFRNFHDFPVASKKVEAFSSFSGSKGESGEGGFFVGECGFDL